MNKTFTYEFRLPNGESHRFEVDVLGKRQPTPPAGGHADWTRLEYRQCQLCPLKTSEHEHCPVALDIERIASQFNHLMSFQEAEVWVHTEDRSYYKKCDIQSGMKSLLGLIMGSGRCPILGRFRPMALSHLPFSSLEETIIRTSGAYLLKQYFLASAGQPEKVDLDFKGLEQFYVVLQKVNHDFMLRIRTASESDVSLNAVYILFSLSHLVSATLKSHLEEYRPLYALDDEPVAPPEDV